MTHTRRYIRLFCFLVIMICLLFYGKVFNPAITLQMCLNNPEKYDGVVIQVRHEATVLEIKDDGFTIQEMGRVIKVVGPNKNIKENEFIDIDAVFHKSGWLELVQARIEINRRYKMIISIFPAIFVIALFFYSFRFDFNKFTFCKRA